MALTSNVATAQADVPQPPAEEVAALQQIQEVRRQLQAQQQQQQQQHLKKVVSSRVPCMGLVQLFLLRTTIKIYLWLPGLGAGIALQILAQLPG